MRKLRLRKGQWLALGHTASKGVGGTRNFTRKGRRVLLALGPDVAFPSVPPFPGTRAAPTLSPTRRSSHSRKRWPVWHSAGLCGVQSESRKESCPQELSSVCLEALSRVHTFKGFCASHGVRCGRGDKRDGWNNEGRFLKILFSNRDHLSTYCVQSTGLAPKGFRLESDPAPTFSGPKLWQGTQTEGDRAGQGRVCGSCPSRGQLGILCFCCSEASSKPSSVTTLSVERQVWISKICRNGGGGDLQAQFLPPSSDHPSCPVHTPACPSPAMRLHVSSPFLTTVFPPADHRAGVCRS